MTQTNSDQLHSLHPLRISAQLNKFLHDGVLGGKLILAAAVLSMIVFNSPLRDSFIAVWQMPLSIGLGDWDLTMSLQHWLNEGLMATFFLVVGLEIKRELTKGELRNRRTALLPIGAALGGMIVPALFYFVLNPSPDTVQGWGIPIATDIAFAVAVLALLGKRVPTSLKVFLLTLAIVDDIGAIIVITLFYAEIIHYGFLAASIALLILMFLVRKQLANRLLLVIVAGLALWVTTHLSGIHASIVGAALGLVAPVGMFRHTTSVIEKAGEFLAPITALFVLPLFAFANAGFVLSTEAISQYSSVAWGIVLGLVIGKPLGILGASWILARLGVVALPPDMNWRQVAGVGFIAGIGFTVSIFITELAFTNNTLLTEAAKASILLASILAATIGTTMLIVASKPIRTRATKH